MQKRTVYIVSSDSDFTRLAIRLREAGMKVIGIGEKKTLKPFITACDKFIYLEILKVHEPSIQEKDDATVLKKAVKQPSSPLNKIDADLTRLLRDSIADIADEEGWAYLGNLGSTLLKKKPDFDSRNYGYSKLLPLIKSMNRFDIDERETGKQNIKHVYLRIKEKNS